MITKSIYTKNITQGSYTTLSKNNHIDDILTSYNGRFKAVTEGNIYRITKIYDNIKKECLFGIANLGTKEIKEKINQYIINDRNTKINELGL